MDERTQSTDNQPDSAREENSDVSAGKKVSNWTVVEEVEDTQVINIQNVDDRESVEPTMLYRHSRNKMVGGVCAGLASYLGWEPVLVRILWVGATFATFGGGVLAYLALWLLLPTGTKAQGQTGDAVISTNQRNSSTLSYVLIGVGAVILLSNLGILPILFNGFWGLVSTFFWPVVLMGIGFMLLNKTSKSEWRRNARNAGQQLRSRFSGQVPSGKSIRNTFSSTRSQLPLQKSTRDRIIMGVCGGISRKVGIDANLIRIGWVALTIFSGGVLGVVAYIALGLILPNDAAVRTPKREIKEVQIL